MSLRRVVIAGVGILFSAVASARGALTILAQDVLVDVLDQRVRFTLILNHAPDLATVDAFGRHAESFQYEINPTCTDNIDACPLEDIRAVMRGDEAGAGKLLPIREGFGKGSDPDPASGGWGPVKAGVPFTQQGGRVTFTTDFTVLDTTDGVFAYRVFTTEFGSTDSLIDGVARPELIPLPAALPVGIVMLGAFAGGAWWRKQGWGRK